MFDKYQWLFYTILAGLTWGVYVPVLNYGAGALGGKDNPVGGRLLVVLCVGVAYFLIGVVLPLSLFMTGQYAWPKASTSGLIFSGLTGVSGAGGAILLILAASAAFDASTKSGINNARFIPPVVYGLAPIVAALVASVWIAKPGDNDPFRFGFEPPGWRVWVGIVLVSCGIILVLWRDAPPKTTPAADTPPQSTSPC